MKKLKVKEKKRINKILDVLDDENNYEIITTKYFNTIE